MATIEQINSEKDELNNLLKEISTYTPETLLRQDLSTELNFKKGLPIFKKFLNLYHELRLCDLDSIPSESLRDIIPKAKATLDGINSIINFIPSKHTYPDQWRDKTIEDSIKSYVEHWKTISPVIAYSMHRETDLEPLVQKAKENIIQMDKMIKNFNNQSEKANKEIKETRTMVHNLAAEAGVAYHAKVFENIADTEYGKKSKYWLWATIGIAIVIVVCGVTLILLHYSEFETIPKSTAEAIHRSIPKLIILSALYYALVWSAKNYNANRHNYIINKHRQNALQTFEAFIKAPESDPATKNAVILQTTQSIFSVQPSGYVHKDSESESPFKLIELIRTVGSSSTR